VELDVKPVPLIVTVTVPVVSGFGAIEVMVKAAVAN
jgi:hypothetical protein